ncbi:MAG: class I SAM-dependent methyltransferase [Desulfomonile sp.]|nr:class I SAM-dependent methyltransferase [Desulfomonile sp.]
MNPDEYRRMRTCEEQLWWYRSLHRYLLRFVPAARDSRARALDIGCGTGGFLRHLMRNGYQVTGLDVSPLAIAELNKEPGATVGVVGDANNLPFENSSFDLVCCVDVLECEPVDPHAAVREAVRVMKPGAMGIFQMAAHQWLLSEHDRAVHSVRRFNRKQFLGLFNVPQVKVLHSSYLFFLLFPLMAVWKLLNPPAQHVDRAQAVSDVKLPNPLFNLLLQLPCALEALVLPYLCLPAGTSVFAMIRKEG